MRKNKSLYIYILLVLALCMSLMEVSFTLQAQQVSDTTRIIWGFVFLISSVLWVANDVKGRNFPRPFEFSFLMYIFWPIALPWYLMKTRGAEGFVLFLGFVALWLAPWMAGLVAYTYFT